MSKRRRKIRKEVIIAIVFSLIIIGLAIGLLIYFSYERLDVDIRDNNEVKLNEEVYNTDFINRLENGTLITEKEKIDTSTLGVVEFKLLFKDNHNKEQEFNITCKVIDNESPTITFKSELTTEVGTKIDLLKDVEVTDNSKEEIEAEVEGDYDFNKEGEYKLYYVAKDSSGNVKKEEFTLKVNKKNEVQPTPTPQPKPNNNTNNNNNKVSDKEFTTSKGFKGVVKNGITYIDGILIANKTYSLPSTYNPGKLTTETQNAANQMIAAAKKDGLSLYVASGFRSYQTQKNMWTNRKNSYGQEFADSGTARAGHSEHQTGLGFDMCGAGNGCITSEYHNTTGAKWMTKNAYKFGLILRYPNGKTNETGYKYESWHFRYVGKELAQKLYNNGDWITLENYFGITSKYSD